MDGESEIRSVDDLEAKLADIMLPFEEIVPEAAKEGLEKVATSHRTSREMLLLSALTSTSALIGKSTLQVFSTYGEKGNLFMVVIGPSGSGKTPACHLGCIDPIVEHLEPKIEKSIVMDDTLSNGLFNHFVSGDSPCPLHRRGTFIFNENNKFVQVSPSRPDTETLVQMFRRRLLVRAEGEQRQTHRELHFATPKEFFFSTREKKRKTWRLWSIGRFSNPVFRMECWSKSMLNITRIPQ